MSVGASPKANNAPAVAEQTTEDDEHVVDIVLAQDWVRNVFTARHGLADGCDMSWGTSVSPFTESEEHALLFQVLLSTKV